jgi:hypothetical protein
MSSAVTRFKESINATDSVPSVRVRAKINRRASSRVGIVLLFAVWQRLGW